VSELTDPKS